MAGSDGRPDVLSTELLDHDPVTVLAARAGDDFVAGFGCGSTKPERKLSIAITRGPRTISPCVGLEDR